MKNLSLILNIILLLAVAYLFMDKFSGNQVDSQPESNPADSISLIEAGPEIVYVNVDSLLENYVSFKKSSEELKQREKNADASLKSRGRALENEAMEFQKKAQTGTMTRKDMEDAEKMLMGKQQKLMADQERMANDLLEESAIINEQLQNKLKEKLALLKKEKGYNYILSYGSGSPVLIAKEEFDITNQVVDMLNADAADK